MAALVEPIGDNDMYGESSQVTMITGPTCLCRVNEHVGIFVMVYAVVNVE